MTPLLECANLDVAYGRTQILFDVSIDVDRGEVLAVLGTNGAGKSTLLRAISGLTPPKGGTVVLDGRNVTGTSPVKMAALGVAHMPGGRGIFPDLTVGENLRMATWPHRRNKARAKRAVDRALDLFTRRSDKTWGLIDCASFLVMQDQGISRAFTNDRHFEQAGFRNLLPPFGST